MTPQPIRALPHSALVAGVAIALFLMAAYVGARILAASHAPATLADGLMAVALLAAEVFITVQAVGYFFSMLKASRQRRRQPPPLFCGGASAAVAVLVASFNESEDVLEETLASVVAMDYPAFGVYLLDDSTRDDSRAAAERIAERYGAQLVRRTDRAGYKAGAINDLLPRLSEPYIALLDADQRPAHSWLREIVPRLDANPRLALVQAPQVYVNTDGLPVAEAAAYQQAVFYEYICEGKSASNAMFCCGSNAVLRRSALLSIELTVGGRRHFFDETSVTEDFATSLRLHAAGWESAYVNRTYVVGMAPETVAAYFTQQMRWAMGTLGVFLRMLRRLVREPGRLRPGQWWEYLTSGSYYLVGIVNIIFMTASVAFLLFGVTPVQMNARAYVALFVPYFIFTMTLFFVGMRLRGYPVRKIWLGTALTFAASWIFVKAAAVALLGLKRAFGVTPKAVGGHVPLTALLPQLAMFCLCSGAAVTGVGYLTFVEADLAYVITSWWSAYHAALLGTLLFYFNRPVTIPARTPLFDVWRATAGSAEGPLRTSAAR